MEDFKDDIDKYANINCNRLSRVHLKECIITKIQRFKDSKIQRIQLSSRKKDTQILDSNLIFFFTEVHLPTQIQKSLYNFSPFSLQLTVLSSFLFYSLSLLNFVAEHLLETSLLEAKL